MKARPLETIPEETVKTPDRVTSDVPKTKPATAKHPGRVASGKRLAERNRLAREAKKTSRSTKTPLQIAPQQITPQQITPQQTQQMTPQTNPAKATQPTLFWGLVV